MKSKLYMQMMNSRQWRELRAWQLTEHPLCEMCKQKGLVVAAECVHHLTPVESASSDTDARTLCFSPSNLQSLCRQCHADIHNAERSHSREAHEVREQERLERWKQRRALKMSGSNPGGSFLGDGAPDSQIHCSLLESTEPISKSCFSDGEG